MRAHVLTLKAALIFGPRGIGPTALLNFDMKISIRVHEKNLNGTQCGLSKQKLVANNDSKKCLAIKKLFRHFSDSSDSGFMF